jgi:hypothetical protein
MLAHVALPDVAETGAWPWVMLTALGALHGLNPAMGWLFAVGLGLQEREESLVRRALLPIAAGHAASITLVVVLFGVLSVVAPPAALARISAGALIGFGVWRVARLRRHPRWVGMRVGFRDLTIWSFLMSTAHGAGLMLAPAFLGLAAADLELGHDHHLQAAGALTASTATAFVAVAVHTAAMLAAAGAIATVVYRVVGLSVLRSAWVNLDLLWAVSLISAGVLLIVLA